MTVHDMIVLADMWINLSTPMANQTPEKIVLLGTLTGREKDRTFRCSSLPSMPSVHEGEPWHDYLHRAVDHVDFIEITGGNSCFSDSAENQDLEKTM